MQPELYEEKKKIKVTHLLKMLKPTGKKVKFKILYKTTVVYLFKFVPMEIILCTSPLKMYQVQDYNLKHIFAFLNFKICSVYIYMSWHYFINSTL